MDELLLRTQRWCPVGRKPKPDEDFTVKVTRKRIVSIPETVTVTVRAPKNVRAAINQVSELAEGDDGQDEFDQPCPFRLSWEAGPTETHEVQYSKCSYQIIVGSEAPPTQEPDIELPPPPSP